MAVLAALVILAILAARALFRLPSQQDRRDSNLIPANLDTSLGRAILPVATVNPGHSGIVSIARGEDAFAARVLLARAAERSLDVQYYIWQKDLTGLPLLDELRQAAARGVRVRLLVDDNGTPDLDAELSGLNTLPNFEVRVFNPFNLRSPRYASYLFDFARLNRRMHNKSFTADSVATIIGGRNIGDIYFGRDRRGQYSDFDLLAVGDAAADVSADFDRYWNSASAYPHELLVTPDKAGLTLLSHGVADALAVADAAAYGEAVRSSALVQALVQGQVTFDWVPVELVSDDPAKGLGKARVRRLIVVRLARIVAAATSSVDVVSAYFVPGRRGLKALRGMARTGRRVRTLTNSFEATDVLPVHASYRKYRRRLLAAGAEVYELKAAPGVQPETEGLEFLGSSVSSLHAKTFTLDGVRVFVGSFNFDPRSAILNCEMGFLVESPRLAADLQQSFDAHLHRLAWRVTKTPGGKLQWETTGPDGARIVTDTEPGTTLRQRIVLVLIGLLPIEWLM